MNRSISKKTAIITLLITFVILIGLVWIATLGAGSAAEGEIYSPGTGSATYSINQSIEYEPAIGKHNLFVTGNHNFEIASAPAGEEYWTSSNQQNRIYPAIGNPSTPGTVGYRYNDKDYSLRSAVGLDAGVDNIFLNLQHMRRDARKSVKVTLPGGAPSGLDSSWTNVSRARLSLGGDDADIEKAMMNVTYTGSWANNNATNELKVNVLAPNNKVYTFYPGATKTTTTFPIQHYRATNEYKTNPFESGHPAYNEVTSTSQQLASVDLLFDVTEMIQQNSGTQNGQYYVNIENADPKIGFPGENSILANWSISGVATMKETNYPNTYVNLTWRSGGVGSGSTKSKSLDTNQSLIPKVGASNPRVIHVVNDADPGNSDSAEIILDKRGTSYNGGSAPTGDWDGRSATSKTNSTVINIGERPVNKNLYHEQGVATDFFNSTIESTIRDNSNPNYKNAGELDILDKYIPNTWFGTQPTFGYTIHGEQGGLNVHALGIQLEVETPEIDITKTSSIVDSNGNVIGDTNSDKASQVNQWIGVFPEDTIEYTITVKNTGGVAVTVDVTDNVPTGTTLVGTPAKGSATSVSVSGRKITWAGVTLAKTNGTATFKFRVKVNKDVLTNKQTTTNTVINDATAIPKGGWENLIDSKTSDKVYNPILSYDKSADKKVITIGSRITYTLTVVNTSTTHDAKQANYPIIVTDNTPKGTQFVTDKVDAYEAKANTVIKHTVNEVPPAVHHANLKWTYTGTLAKNNGSIAYKFQVVVKENPDKIGTIKNTAYFNDHKDDEDTPIVEIRKSSKPKDGAYVLAGGEITYYLDVKNLSTEYGIEAEAITVTDAIPEKTTYINGSADNGGTFDEASNKIKWKLPGIGKGETLRLSFKVKIDDEATGIIKNHAIMTVGGEDTPTNEVKHHIIDIVKDSDPAPGSTVKEGSDILYKVTVTNTSTEDAKGKLLIRDKVPENTTFKEVYDGGATGDNKVIEWTLDGLKAGESVTVTFKVTVNYVKDPANTIIKNVAMVVDEDGNETPSNEVEHKLEEVPFDLGLDKMVSKISVTINGKTTTKEFTTKQLQTIEVTEKDIPNATADIEYTITAKNEGELPGMVKEIVDYLPAGTTFDLSKNPGWRIEGNKVYTTALENTLLNPGETATVKLVLTIKLSDLSDPLLRNIAEISKDWNEVDREDINSTPDNYTADQNPIENDTGIAETLISVRTGLLNSNYIYYLTLGIILLATSVTLQFMAKRAREQE